MVKNKLIILLIVLITYSCKTNNAKEDSNVRVVEPKLKIILIDASGSFNPVKNRTEDLFSYSCNQIINEHLSKASEGDLILVRAIRSNSYGTESLICQIDFTKSKYCFSKTITNKAGEDVLIKREKDEFNDTVKPQMQKIINEAISKFKIFYEKYKNGSSENTDLCGALANIPIDIKQINVKSKHYELLIYSDLKNTTNINRCKTFESKGLIIRALYVNDKGYSPEQYNNFRDSMIGKFFKGAETIELFNPVHSQNK
jgi:hypothetical protein